MLLNVGFYRTIILYHVQRTSIFMQRYSYY